jgi:predicted enzyme related to lactoylglutathione lyase
VIDYYGRFVWYELMTTDMTAAKVFYASVVGWGAQDASTPRMAYALFTVSKAFVSGLVGLSEDARKLGATPRWVGYVGVDDVDAAVDRVKRRGGAVHVPPTDVSDLSRFSIVADPQMASLALIKWLRPNQQQTAELGKPGRVGWHELHSTDVEKAFAFYGELFDWQKADADTGPLGTYQLFSAAGQTIGGMFTMPPTGSIPFWLYYFNVGDIDVASERVRAGGGQVIEGPLELPGGSWIARCMDPQGAMFALEGKRNPNAVGYFARVASRGFARRTSS